MKKVSGSSGEVRSHSKEASRGGAEPNGFLHSSFLN